MTYSSAIFKTEHEDLKIAQLLLLAQIDGKHEVLEIGCRWGSLAIDVVKRTGCRYTGITLSEEQLKYAKRRAKQAGLESFLVVVRTCYQVLALSPLLDFSSSSTAIR
ncbi:hypothetical protein Cni_G29405 [Canna indica]|uniref:Cyclopropane-fatty-acyl-phospholipid synthase n=1 Tax=Canna indica TaxID=4628 RepID=A0AAQ3L6Q7_9LILI|nr:hypothetical protein Cni_G29405 [Canna indica]